MKCFLKSFFTKSKSPLLRTFIFGVILILICILITAAIFFMKVQDSDHKAAIVTNGYECAEMGKKIFEKGGNVADVAVTVVLCEGVATPQSSGVGGGFVLTMYIRKTQQILILNSREVAPKAATWDMYKDNPQLSIKGGLAVAVPSEIKGLWDLHQKFGKLPWKDLVTPVVEICRQGTLVSFYLENIFKELQQEIRNEPTLREIFINPVTNEIFKRGEKIVRKKLAETFEIVAEEGADVIYGGGELGKKLVEDVRARGGILSEEDLREYEPQWLTPISTKLTKNLNLHSMPLPSSAAMINFIFNILSGYSLTEDALSFHRMTEAMKFAYAKRTFLGDDKNDLEVLEAMQNLSNQTFADITRSKINDTHTFGRNVSYYGAKFETPDDHGTAHMSILAPNGDAISVTNSINFKLGAKFASEATGIILNNQMDDFSNPGVPNVYGIPPSPANFVRPSRHPLSSMSPSIVTDENGDVKLVVGAAGGSRIPTGVFATIFHHIFLNKSLHDAISARRLHHQLVPYTLQFESGFDEKILWDLSVKFGHELLENRPDGGFAAVTAISVVNGKIEAAFDPRRGGSYEIF